MEKFKTYIAIDDTDEIGYFISTGEICEHIAKHINSNYSKTTPITRHQLYLHESIAYTSHNSSMCFTCQLNPQSFEEVKAFILEYITHISAPSSSGGVAMVFEKDIFQNKTLIDYGFDAKNKVLNKDLAYRIAKEQNVFLQEIKNEGNGIIGALAGVALRLSGNDGRLRGKITLDKRVILPEELLVKGFVDGIEVVNGKALIASKKITFDDGLKWILKEGKRVLLVEDTQNFYRPLGKESLAVF
ncbi:MAG: hypothetical protein WC149_05440 [Arcobacteraceae bacterium]